MSLLHEDLARARWRDAERKALPGSRAARIVAARRGSGAPTPLAAGPG